MMTLEEFRASKVWYDHLCEAQIGADDVVTGGYVYAEICWIEKWPHGWGLIIENRQWSNRPLEELEAILYEEWYVHEAAELDKIHSD